MILKAQKEFLIDRVNALVGIPLEVLSNKWDSISDAVKFTYSISEKEDNFSPTVISIFRKTVGSLNKQYEEILNPTFDFVLSANEIRSPLPSTPPIGINPEALHIWKAVLKVSKKRIKSYSDPLEKWAAAIILFKRASSRKGISPFMDGKMANKTSKSPITSFLASYVDPIVEYLLKIEKDLSRRNILQKTVSKTFKDTSFSTEGKNTIAKTTKIWRLKKGESARSVIQYMIPKLGLKKVKPRVFKKKFGPKANLFFSYLAKEPNKINVHIEIILNSKMWTAIKSDKKDPNKFITNWIKRGFKATGNVLPIDMTDKEKIEMVYPADTEQDVIKLMNKLTIPYIINIGDETYQVSLVLYLIKNIEKFSLSVPSYYKEFVSDPEKRKEFKNKYYL